MAGLLGNFQAIGGLLGPDPRAQSGGLPGARQPASIGGMFADFGANMNRLREENPEALLALSAGLLQGDFASGISGMGQAMGAYRRDMRGDRLARDRMAQDQSQFDARLTQDQRQFAAGHALDRGRFSLAQADYNDAQGRRQALSSSTAKLIAAQGGPQELVDLAEAGGGAEAYDMWRGMNTRPAAPSGYRYAGDGVSLQPIPGGPADKANLGPELPAELGARIGLGDAYLEDYTRDDPNNPGIRQRIEGGAFDADTLGGIGNRAGLAAGVGDGGEIWRRVESGRDALIRNLTGAGMSMSEAENQAARYQIRPTDTRGDMLDKLDGLQRDLEATRSGAIGAKSGTLSRDPPGTRRAEKPATLNLSGMSDTELEAIANGR